MNVLAAQQQKINELAEFAAALRNSVRGAVDNRHERMAHLQERKFDLKRARAAKRPDAECVEIEADILQLEEIISAIDEQLAGANAEAGAARNLVRRLLEKTGTRHIDFPDDNTGALGRRLPINQKGSLVRMEAS